MVLEVGARAPDFTLDGIDGHRYALPDALASGPVTLIFFKTTCATCDLTFPYLNRLTSSYSGDGWRLLAIAQDPAEAAREYAQRLGLTFPVLIDQKGYLVSQLYDPPATPTLFLIEPDRRIAYTTHGFSKDDLNDLSAAIAHRLGVEPQVIAQRGDGQPDFRPG